MNPVYDKTVGVWFDSDKDENDELEIHELAEEVIVLTRNVYALRSLCAELLDEAASARRLLTSSVSFPGDIDKNIGILPMVGLYASYVEERLSQYASQNEAVRENPIFEVFSKDPLDSKIYGVVQLKESSIFFDCDTLSDESGKIVGIGEIRVSGGSIFAEDIKKAVLEYVRDSVDNEEGIFSEIDFAICLGHFCVTDVELFSVDNESAVTERVRVSASAMGGEYVIEFDCGINFKGRSYTVLNGYDVGDVKIKKKRPIGSDTVTISSHSIKKIAIEAEFIIAENRGNNE